MFTVPLFGVSVSFRVLNLKHQVSEHFIVACYSTRDFTISRSAKWPLSERIING